MKHWKTRRWLTKQSPSNPGGLVPPRICSQPFAPVRIAMRGSHFRSWWGHVMPDIVASAEHNCSVPCMIRGVRAADAHVVVDTFSPGPTPVLSDDPSSGRGSSLSFDGGAPQKIAVLALEAGGHGEPHTSKALERTDLLISWMRDSDVPINYMYGWQDLCRHIRPDPLDIEACMAPVSTRQQLQKKRLGAAFVSNCGPKAGERRSFMRNLFYELETAGRPVDSWGKCLRTPGLPRNPRLAIPKNRSLQSKARPAPKTGADAMRGFEKIALLETRYKFAFALENVIRPDYLTEKALQPLLASVIPVIWGAPNACDFLPGGCINALDFPTPRALAQHLLDLDRNHTRYLAYFAWRRDQGGAGPSATWVQLQSQSFTSLEYDQSWPCRLCKAYRHRCC